MLKAKYKWKVKWKVALISKQKWKPWPQKKLKRRLLKKNLKKKKLSALS